MVLMRKKDAEAPSEDVPVVDCRKCVFYPKPNTTGKTEDLLLKTDKWTKSFCGTDECEDKTYATEKEKKGDGEEDSVVKGDTDDEQKKKDTDNGKSEA